MKHLVDCFNNCLLMTVNRFLVFAFMLGNLLLLAGIAYCQDTLQLSQRILADAQVEIYKRVGPTELRISIVYPPDRIPGQTYPALVLFYGGGWIRGRVTQFDKAARYFAKRGMIALAVDYRVSSRQHTTPLEAAQDGRSAMRWVRKNAGRLGIEPGRIVAGGGSAGGHLALATAFLDHINEPGEDTSVSAKPSALVLFNPVTKTTSGGYGYDRLADRAKSLSPVEYIHPGAPAAIIFHGEADTTVPIKNANEFCQLMTKAGNICELHRFPGKKHGFANDVPGNEAVYNEVIDLTDRFLTRLGYLSPTTRKY